MEELPQLEPKLVVISNFAEGRAIIVTVAKSRLIGNVDPEEYLTNAEVDLYWNNTFLERLEVVIPKDPNYPPYYKSWENKPVAGLEYTIKVSVDGFKPVMAKSSVPPSVKITDFDLANVVTEPVQGGAYNRKHFSAIVDFDDPSTTKNYYHLNITQQINNYVLEGRDTLITKSMLQPVLFDPLDNENGISAHLNGGLLFEDKPGKQALGISFSVDIDPRSQLLGKTYVELRTLSREYYLYYTSLSRSEGSNPNPLNDPVIVFENIENGYGIFAGYSNSLDSVQFVQ
ncbi:DUF4249 domain-containing protein [Flavilitoribacter nigricans]|uniref:DUF4249 domain-containing protein n=1 Tax=Flavilitoribacter nigricans TaxID=70997 RepID=UPI001C9E2D72|nr:DUF4249 domain-containing protein [Flavilitoribacter nigricans]